MNEFLLRMKSLLGDEFDGYLKFYNGEDVFRGLRVNLLKCSPEHLADMLDFELKPTPFCRGGYYLPDSVSQIGNNPLHHAGAFYVQEPSACSAVTVLDVQKGENVLDLCAAPGGKSTQIAAALEGEGLLWSNEIVKNRAEILLSNIERLGIRNAVVSNCRPDELCERLAGRFDRVLVDAPCSGEGMFRKNSAEAEWSVEHVKSCAERQLNILSSAKLALRPGGVLVYSTCTFSREENEGVITRFLSENPEFELEDCGLNVGRSAMELARRIFPMDGGEGHFVAKLRKTGEGREIFAEIPTRKAAKNHRKGKNVTVASTVPDDGEILKFYDSLFVNRPFGENIKIEGDNVIILPKNYDVFYTDGLKILRVGIVLGKIAKNRIEPHHCAFMAAQKNECRLALDFDVKSPEIAAFLHGEEICVPANLAGCVAVCVGGVTTGFGKAVNGRLKNKYPKGLRVLK